MSEQMLAARGPGGGSLVPRHVIVVPMGWLLTVAGWPEVVPIGTLAIYPDGSAGWWKTGAASTAWTPVGALATAYQPVIIPNGTLPYSTGLVAPVGTIATWANGTKAFLCWGTAPTDWVKISDVGQLTTSTAGLVSNLVRAGQLERLFANGFDPSVTGYTAPVGSRGTSADGTRAWVKWGTADRNWKPLHIVSGTLGAPATVWDLAGLAGDSNGGFEVEFHGDVDAVGAGPTATGRVNGGVANIRSQRLTCANSSSMSVQFDYLLCGHIVSNFQVGDTMTVTWKCIDPVSGKKRFIKVDALHERPASGSLVARYDIGLLYVDTAAELGSVGFSCPAGTTFSAASKWTLRRPI